MWLWVGLRTTAAMRFGNAIAKGDAMRESGARGKAGRTEPARGGAPPDIAANVDRPHPLGLRGRAPRREADDLLAMLAHELRNVLAPIRYSVSLLEAARAEQPADAGVLRVLHRNVDHLDRLVADALDVARVRTGKLQLQLEPVALEDLVLRTMESCRVPAHERGQDLVLEAGMPRVQLRVDAMRLGQALDNLVLNAIKYTPAQGSIRVRASSDGATARIEVQDNGAGFEAGAGEQLFGLYRQGREGAYGGLGIGLHVVRQILELHGGGASASSAGPATGSTFAIWLPIRA